ncbi:MAG: hypothetical protein IJS46_01685, partial [Kiritimatiellae bacterium]|nr:hypothetical protein [Kiritimatiellia bacterium]
ALAAGANVPMCLNEWLPSPSHEKLGTALQAAEIAAMLIEFQNGPVDSAAIYDARCGLGNYSPLFNPLTYKPHKAYYAFMAFNELRKRGTAVGVLRDDPCPGVYSAAARGADGSVAAMLANTGAEETPFSLHVAGNTPTPGAAAVPPRWRCRIVDNTRTWDETPLPAAMPPRSIILLANS